MQLPKKITLFDKIFSLIVILGIIFVGFLFFRKTEYITITLKVGDESIRYEPWQVLTGQKPWFTQLLKEGMKEQDGLGRIMAEVTGVYIYDTTQTSQAAYITTRLNTVYNRATNQYTFKGSPILIGSPIKLNLNNLYVDGLITDIEGHVNATTTKKTLKIDTRLIEDNPTFPNTSGVYTFVADAIPVGATIKDNHGNPIIKIVDKKVGPATLITTTSTGNALVQNDPQRKNVILTLELTATDNNKKYFLFDDIPLLINSKIPINLPSISIFPTITNIYSD